MNRNLLCAALTASLIFSGVATVQAQQSTSPANTTQPGTNHAGDMGHQQSNCSMSFTLSGWSAIYKTASGKGTLTCGSHSIPVKLSAKGGGLTFGHYKITNGQATFTNVDQIKDVLGSYAEGAAHAGASKSARSGVMTKGNVSMAFSGTGNGWDIGVGFGSFTIARAGATRPSS